MFITDNILNVAGGKKQQQQKKPLSIWAKYNPGV